MREYHFPTAGYKQRCINNEASIHAYNQKLITGELVLGPILIWPGLAQWLEQHHFEPISALVGDGFWLITRIDVMEIGGSSPPPRSTLLFRTLSSVG